MSTEVLVKKLNREVIHLRKDVGRLREVFFQVIADPEGAYRNDFVKKMLLREKETPRFRYTTSAKFLQHVRGK